jgi:hypothetical protein
MLTIKWRGKPVFIKHRTEAEIEASRAVPTASLRHPEDDQVRTKDTHPHILICLGVCTHLGYAAFARFFFSIASLVSFGFVTSILINFFRVIGVCPSATAAILKEDGTFRIQT